MFLFIRNVRSVIIASLAIPTSIIATFTLLKVMDFTLNNMTLLALTLAVGIVIDDAIVVLENIVRYLHEKRYEPRAAAIEATKEITLAVLATTLSLVIIFLPIAFMTGYARRYVNQFGWTMAFSILVSMLVSFTLTPMLSSRLLRRPPEGSTDHEKKEWPFFAWVDRRYGRILRWSLDHRKAVVLMAAGTFLLVFPLNYLVGRDWIPPDDQGELSAILNLPEGSSLDATVRVSTDLAKKIVGPEGDRVRQSLRPRGRDPQPLAHLREAGGPEQTQFLEPGRGGRGPQAVRVHPEPALQGHDPVRPGRRRELLPHPRPDPGPRVQRGGAPLEGRRPRASAAIPGLTDVDTSISVNSPELEVKIDRQRASDLGVRASDVGNAVRLMIAGQDQISTYKEGDEQYDVTLQLLPEQQKNPEILARLVIPSSKVGQVRLESIASIEQGLGPARIERYNRQFQGQIFANNAPGFPLDAAARAAGEEIRKAGLPPGYGFKFTGSVKILDETTREPHHRVPARLHLHVHGPGRAVRELPAPVHHHAVRCR